MDGTLHSWNSIHPQVPHASAPVFSLKGFCGWIPPPGPGFLLEVFKLLFMHADDIIKSVPFLEF